MTSLEPQQHKISAMRETVRSAAFSHIGLVRSSNEDRILDDGERGLFAVADGMGGHSLGDWAATMVVQALNTADFAGRAEPAICGALDDANRLVHAKAQERGVICGSTVAGVAVERPGFAFLFWAGDSRIYRFRKDVLERLSRDHSVVQELLDAGVLNRAQARNHPRGNVITRAVGVAPAIEIETCLIEYEVGDIYLICSDGISGALEDNEIAPLLRTSPITVAAAALRDAALRAGGRDNLSAVIIAT